MPNEDKTNFDRFFDDDGDAVKDGQLVKVNGSHTGKLNLKDDGDFTVEGWPVDQIIDTLERVDDLPIDIDTIHPMIKE